MSFTFAKPPIISTEGRPFWLGTLERRFLLQQDRDSGRTWFIPRPFNLVTFEDPIWIEAQGAGDLVAMTAVPDASGNGEFGAGRPFGVVRLAEGPVVLTMIINAPTTLDPGTPMHLVWGEENEEYCAFAFEPRVPERPANMRANMGVR